MPKSKALTNFAPAASRELSTYIAKKFGADKKTVKQIGDLSAKAGSYLRSFIPFNRGSGKVRRRPVRGYLEGGMVVLKEAKAPKKKRKTKAKK